MPSSPPSDTPVLFDLHDLRVSYANTVALDRVTLKIREGEKISFIGRSGSGKTTLLKTLHELKKNQSAFVHQHYALVPQLSVFHNAYMGRLDRYSTFYNLLNLIKPQQQEQAIIRPILQSLDLEEKIFEKAGALSGGQQQRAAVARALFRGSEIVLADEPVASVDPHQSDNILRLIRTAAKTLILSMHDVQFALRFADRIIGLRSGKIYFDLPADQVTEELLKELYRPC